MSSLISNKIDVKEWVRTEEYTMVKANSNRAPFGPYWNIYIPEYRDDCKLVLDQKRPVVSNVICIF